MARFVKHAPCPRCGSRDNLGTYDDGSSFCFGCHYSRRPTSSGHHVPVDGISHSEDLNVQLSPYLCFDFPGHVVDWLARYDISVAEAIKHGWKYDPQRDQLVFIFYGVDGEPAVVQARNFAATARTKYYNSGSPGDVLPIFSSGNPSRTLAVVEDAVSAVRIARQIDAMPCLGSHLPVKKLIRLQPSYEVLLVWLDSDKLKEAWEIADRAKWIGFSARTIYTEKDPKEYSDEEIKKLVEVT
jgi:hypothetical protein